MNLTPSEITGFGSLILGGLIHLKTKKKNIARFLYAIGVLFIVAALFSQKAKNDQVLITQNASTMGSNSPANNQTGITKGSNSPVIQSGPNSTVKLDEQNSTSIKVDSSPNAVVQTAVNSPNALQIAINNNVNQRWRFLTEGDLSILTNKLVGMPILNLEVACSSDGDADFFADQLSYVFHLAGLTPRRRNIMYAGSVFPPGLSILDNRQTTNNMEVLDQIITAFKSVGIQVNKIERHSEAERPFVYIFVGVK